MIPRSRRWFSAASAFVLAWLGALSPTVPAVGVESNPIQTDAAAGILGSSEGTAALDAPDFALWGLGDREPLVRELIVSSGLGTVASVENLEQLGNARALVVGDSPIPQPDRSLAMGNLSISTPDDLRAATKILDHRRRLGKPMVVLGTGEHLRRLLGIASEQPDASIREVREEMRMDEDGAIHVDSASPASDATPPWERIYVPGISSAGAPYHRYYFVAPTEFPSVLQRVLEQSLGRQGPSSQEVPMIGAPLGPPSPEPTDSIGTDWINYQVEDWVINIPQMEWRTRIKRWKLNDIYIDRDWYLVDVNTDTAVKDYSCHQFSCGWWVHRRTHTNELDLYDEKFHKGFLDEYGPPTDTSDHTTTSYSIGANLSSSSFGGSAAVSRTVNKPAVFITAQRSFADDWVGWIEDFRGPDYTWWPWISEPAAASHNAYYTDHDTITRATGGASTTPNGIKVQVDAKVILYKDSYIHPCGWFFLCWWRSTLVPSVSGAIATDIYSSRATLLYPSNGALLTSRTPTLDWSGASGADYWYVEISRSGWSSSAYVSSSQWTTPLLVPGYTYSWKVWSRRSTDEVWGYATPARNFTVR